MSSAGRDSTPPRASSPWIGRVATYVLPTFSVLLSALVFLGPGALRPAIGARVRGAPAEGGRVAALRVEVVRSLYEIIDNPGVQSIEVEASALGQSLGAWRGTTGPDGIAEVQLSGRQPLHGPLVVRVATQGDRPKLLAGGEIALGPPPPAFVQLGAAAGAVHGDLAIRVDITRGILASPFPEVVRVHVSPQGVDAPLGARAELEISGAGVEATPDRLSTDERGVAAFRLKALHHQVELSVVARALGKTARWEGMLPVVPGAMWLSPLSSGGTLALISPAPRDQAYVSFWTEEGRIAGAVVPLTRDPQGFFAGEVKPPPLSGVRVAYATVAGDAMEQGAGTVAWPLQPAEGGVVGKQIGLLFDGLPGALDREKQRAWVARRTGLVLVGAAALAEALLLLMLSRASQRRLETHLVEASGPLPDEAAMPADDRLRLLGSAREHPVLRLLLAMALTFLAFALVTALSTFR